MSLLNAIFDLIFMPFRNINPLFGLIFISLVVGILALIIYRYTSNQQAIKQVKNRIKAYFLEFKLYKDNLGVLVSALGNIIWKNLTYMRYSLIPLCLMIIPFGFVAIQLALRYESRPFRPGETTVLTVLFKNAVPDFEKPVKLIVPDGLMVDSKPVRIESEKSVAWRLKTLKPGIYEVGVQVGNEQISKKIILIPFSITFFIYCLHRKISFLPGGKRFKEII